MNTEQRYNVEALQNQLEQERQEKILILNDLTYFQEQVIG